MKSTLLCNRVEYVFSSEVEYYLMPNLAELKDGTAWREVMAQGTPEYNQDVKPDASGTLSDETLTLNLEYDAKHELVRNPWQRYVLRLHTNEGVFLMGNTLYPATLSFTQNLRLAALEFKCQRPY